MYVSSKKKWKEKLNNKKLKMEQTTFSVGNDIFWKVKVIHILVIWGVEKNESLRQVF